RPGGGLAVLGHAQDERGEFIGLARRLEDRIVHGRAPDFRAKGRALRLEDAENDPVGIAESEGIAGPDPQFAEVGPEGAGDAFADDAGNGLAAGLLVHAVLAEPRAARPLLPRSTTWSCTRAAMAGLFSARTC